MGQHGGAWAKNTAKGQLRAVKVGLVVLALATVLAAVYLVARSSASTVVIERDPSVSVEIPSGAGSEGVGAEKAQNSLENGSAQLPEEEASYIFIHMAGAVCEPGVYEVPEGARVSDALIAAGGFAPEASTDAVNLARVLVDGEQVYVPTVSEVESSSSGGSGMASWGVSTSDSSSQGKININTASASLLEELPGIGPALAQNIVDERQTNGAFAAIDELKRVSGIGDKKLDQISPFVCI